MTSTLTAVKLSLPLRSAAPLTKLPRFLVPFTSIAPIKLLPRLILTVRGGQSGIPEIPFRTPQEFPSVPGNRPSISPPEIPRPTKTPEMDPAGDTPLESSPDSPRPEWVPNPNHDFPIPPLESPDEPDIPDPLRPPQDPPDTSIPPLPRGGDSPIYTPQDIVPPPELPPGIKQPTGTTIF